MKLLEKLMDQILSKTGRTRESLEEELISYLRSYYSERLTDPRVDVIRSVKEKILSTLHGNGKNIELAPRVDVKTYFNLSQTEEPFFDNAYFELEIDQCINSNDDQIFITKKGIKRMNEILV